MTATTGGITLADWTLYLQGQGLLTEWPGINVQRDMPTAEVFARGLDRMLILTDASGPGLSFDGAFDGAGLTVRAVGRQGDYDDAKALAFWVDRALLRITGSNLIGAAWTLGVSRAGGQPEPIMQDTARRVHFSCSYVSPVTSGL